MISQAVYKPNWKTFQMKRCVQCSIYLFTNKTRFLLSEKINFVINGKIVRKHACAHFLLTYTFVKET